MLVLLNPGDKKMSKKHKVSAWNRYFAAGRKAGKSPKQIGAAWKSSGKKSGSKKSGGRKSKAHRKLSRRSGGGIGSSAIFKTAISRGIGLAEAKRYLEGVRAKRGSQAARSSALHAGAKVYTRAQMVAAIKSSCGRSPAARAAASPSHGSILDRVKGAFSMNPRRRGRKGKRRNPATIPNSGGWADFGNNPRRKKRRNGLWSNVSSSGGGWSDFGTNPAVAGSPTVGLMPSSYLGVLPLVGGLAVNALVNSKLKDAGAVPGFLKSGVGNVVAGGITAAGLAWATRKVNPKWSKAVLYGGLAEVGSRILSGLGDKIGGYNASFPRVPGVNGIGSGGWFGPDTPISAMNQMEGPVGNQQTLAQNVPNEFETAAVSAAMLAPGSIFS